MNTSSSAIHIVNAHTHNLKGVSCQIPIGELTVISGVSGSGKSSLAFDTLYAEGQRRYVTSLSTYARQYLERLPRPVVDFISNLPPAIAIEQRNTVTNARSTVGSATEILDYLRLLYEKLGERNCCGRPVQVGTIESITAQIIKDYTGNRVVIGVELPSDDDTGPQLVGDGFSRILLKDGRIADIADMSPRQISRARKSALSIIDRFSVKGDESITRLSESIASALKRGEGKLVAINEKGDRIKFQSGNVCGVCDTRYQDATTGLFSWNSALGACSECQGFGRIPVLDLELIVPDPTLSLKNGAIAPFSTPSTRRCQRDLLKACKRMRIPITKAWESLNEGQRKWVFDGDKDGWYGITGFFKWLEKRRYKVQARVAIARFRRFDSCPSCLGARLRPDALGIFIRDCHIGDLTKMTIEELFDWLSAIRLDKSERARGERLMEILLNRVGTAMRIGLGYLGVDRHVRSLSGGEAQRIQLTTALGGALTATLYVLDEPSIGLHSRDVGRLLDVLRNIRDQGNTVVVVEHAPEIIRSADYLIELGPGAGQDGGHVVAEGDVQIVSDNKESATGRVLSGSIKHHKRSNRSSRGHIRVLGARENNLRDINVDIPLGQLVCVTGVSGAGKSTLIRSVLVGQLKRTPDRGECDGILGGNQVSDVIVVEPTPPGKSLRSNPATVSGVFEEIRKRLAKTTESRVLGLTPGWFSFNRPGGRCERCEGTGQVVVDMQFLEDLRIPCDYCNGTRYGPEARRILLDGLSVVDFLDESIAEINKRYSEVPKIARSLEPFVRVGLGYLKLKQPMTTLSGGELQRLRLALALGSGQSNSLYVLDEPTTGLHSVEVQRLVGCLDQLIDGGASVIVIEHNLELIEQSDWVIDLGPEGGPGGGNVIAQGTPDQIAQCGESITGCALANSVLG